MTPKPTCYTCIKRTPNLDHVHEALGGTFPYNVWLRTDPAVPGAQIVDGTRELGFAVVTARDARELILAEQTRPERQGLFGLLSVGFLAAAVLTVLGFLVYAVVSFYQRTVQLGMLRAVGLSVGQMAAYLAGAGLGTGLGVWASRLFIPFLQVGEGKTAVTPPFEEYVVVDSAGRLQIPPDLRERAGIGDRVSLEATEDGILIKPVAGENGQGIRRWFKRKKRE